MKKILCIAIVAVSISFIPHFARADVVISEVMYDAPGTDTDHEWIEIYNDGSASETMTSWKFVEEGSNHGIADAGSGSALPGGEYGIIASNPSVFKSDYPSFDGVIFDSSWSSFNNSGEALALKDAGGNIEFQFTYDPSIGAAGDGQTLQDVAGEWAHGPATPGAENEAGDTTTGGGETPPPEEEEDILINTYKPAAKIVPVGESIAGAMTTLHALVTNESNNEIAPEGIFDWNFGDGTTARLTDNATAAHQYENPGDYSLWLGYKRYESMVDYTLIARFKLTVKEGSVVISRVLAGSGIELANLSTTDKDISFWHISQDGKIFAFPTNTILLTGKKIIFSTRTLGFAPDAEKPILLNYPNGVAAAAYQKPVSVAPKFAGVSASSKTSAATTSTKDIVEVIKENIAEAIATEDLSSVAVAAASESPASGEITEQITKHRKYYPYLLGLILLAGISIVVMRRYSASASVTPSPADDIQILE